MRALILLLLLLLPAGALAQAFSPQEAARVDRIVAAALQSTGVPSASVAVVRGGRLAFARAYGRQSPTIPVATTTARYAIASISKQFTAAAILLLAEEGRLSLDDPVGRYLPGVTGGDRISILQLLSHTSGLRDYWPQDYSFAAMASPTTPQAILDRWAKAPLDFEPGSQWQYSNTGYVAAGLIVEQVAGEPLVDFLRRRIFRPLGMGAVDADTAMGTGDAAGYGRNALGPVRQATPSAPGWLFAAGELAMTPSDLARWDIARIDRAILSRPSWAAQETPAILTGGKPTDYGLGVFVGEAGGHRMIRHNGEAVGFLSENRVFPDDRDAVVVFVNAWFGNAQATIADGINSLLLLGGDPTALARSIYAQLAAGTLDRALLTPDADAFFDATVRADYRDSLAPLGPPQSFALRRSQLRGGFRVESYLLGFADGRRLAIAALIEPQAGGRIEQFLVTPVD